MKKKINLTNDEENVKLVQNFHSNIYFSPSQRNEGITHTRARISQIKKEILTKFLRDQLEKSISIEKTQESISALVCGKTLGLDGLPNEFYKEIGDLLSPLLFLV